MSETNFLQEKYADLPGSHPVNRAVDKAIREGVKGPTTKEDRIDAYLNRIDKLIFAEDPEKSNRAISLLRKMVLDEYVYPHKEKMAKGATAVEEKAAHDLGIEAYYDEDTLRERGEIAVKDLEGSLDQWIDYLSNPAEPYSTQFRYYAFRNILGLGRYDKDKGEFPKRSAGTSLLFPDVDRSALGYLQDMIKAGYEPEFLAGYRAGQEKAGAPQDLLLTKEKALEFAKMPFAKQYAESIRQKGEINPELLIQTKGEWRKFPQGSNPTDLWQSLQNKGTAWCTTGYATAETQLKGGDFYVYYTLDRQGNPAIPRIAIRMQGYSIGEVRGVADKDQNLEGNMTEIAEGKMRELPGWERYQKVSSDMRLMTQIEKKIKQGQTLIKEDLIFLYEINGKIEGFGYEEDPRIKELRGQRNLDEDMPVVFGCEKSQIARNINEINADTKAYIGKLVPNIFKLLPGHIEHIYTSFPEGRIRRGELTIGGKSKAALLASLKEAENKGVYVGSYGEGMIQNRDFTTLPKSEKIDTVRLRVRDLGFDEWTTLEQLFERAETFGLELCPAETGLYMRLADMNQPNREWYYIGMKPITNSGGKPDIFILERDGEELYLSSGWPSSGCSGSRCYPDHEFVFQVHK